MLPRYSKLVTHQLEVSQTIRAEIQVDTWRYTPGGLKEALKRTIQHLDKAGFNSVFMQKDAVSFLLYATPKNLHDIRGIEEAYRKLTGVNALEA